MGILTALAIASAFQSPQVWTLFAKKIEPIIQLDFAVPHETKGWIGRCDQHDEWNKAWKQFHSSVGEGAPVSLPKLDFSKYMAVGICSDIPIARVVLVDVVETADAVFIRYRRGGVQWRPEPFDDEESRKRAERTSRYLTESYRFRLAFIVLPATKKKIVIQINFSSRLSSYKWRDETVLNPSK
jgi:hypothetical protein